MIYFLFCNNRHKNPKLPFNSYILLFINDVTFFRYPPSPPVTFWSPFWRYPPSPLFCDVIYEWPLIAVTASSRITAVFSIPKLFVVISSKIKYAELDNVKIDILKIADTGQKIQKDALDRIPASTCI